MEFSKCELGKRCVIKTDDTQENKLYNLFSGAHQK